MNSDILEILANADLPILQSLYKSVSADMDHVYNYLSSVLKWKRLHPKSEYFTILVARDWKENGTFIGINQYYCSELFIGSLEGNCETLSKVIAETKKIDWTKAWLIYSMYGKAYPYVIKALDNTTFEHGEVGDGNIWRVAKEKAKDFVIKCPEDVYISELQPCHAAIINPVWPPRYIDSQYYLETLIKMNGGYGVFLKSNNQLVAWAIRNLIGLGAIQTLDGYKEKGYGGLVTMYLSKKIADEGYHPLGTVRQGNIPSERMFTRMGFELVGIVRYIDNKQMLELENAVKKR